MCPKYALLLQDTYGRHLLDFSYRADCRTVGLEPLTNTTHLWARKSHPYPTWSREAQKDKMRQQESVVESGNGARMTEGHSVPHVQPVFGGEHLAGTSVTVSHSSMLRSSQQQQCKACEFWWRRPWPTTEQFVSTVLLCARKISHNQVPPIYNYVLLCF